MFFLHVLLVGCFPFCFVFVLSCTMHIDGYISFSSYFCSTGQWMWNGCDDGVKFGDRFSRKYLDGVINGANIRAIVNLHNNGVGRKVCLIVSLEG